MSKRVISENVHVCLTSDIHGFPTFAVKYRHTRYNFCHLKDVCDFLHKIYHVDNDRLLHKQRGSVPARKLTHNSEQAPSTTRALILALCHEPIQRKEIVDYVLSDYPTFNRKQIENQITVLLGSKQLGAVGYGRYITKECADVAPRQLNSVTE